MTSETATQRAGGARARSDVTDVGLLRGPVRGRSETARVAAPRSRSFRSRATADFDEFTMIAAGSLDCRGRDERQATAASALRCPHSTGRVVV